MAVWTTRRARRCSLQRLLTIEASLIMIARHWDDLDMSVIDEVDGVRAQIAELRASMEAAVEIAEDGA